MLLPFRKLCTYRQKTNRRYLKFWLDVIFLASPSTFLRTCFASLRESLFVSCNRTQFSSICMAYAAASCRALLEVGLLQRAKSKAAATENSATSQRRNKVPGNALSADI